MEPLDGNIWSKTPGYETDGSDDDGSDSEGELVSFSQEQLGRVMGLLRDRWQLPTYVNFSSVAWGEASATTTASHLQLPPCRNRSTMKPTFRVRHIDAPVVTRTLLANNFQQTQERNFLLQWSGARLSDSTYKALLAHQKVNHFPGSTEVTRKDRLWLNFRRMAKKFGREAFDFIPESFVLPDQLDDFLKSFQKAKNRWIVKPAASSRGRGIFVLQDLRHLPLQDSCVVSQYIDNPLLIQGLKFDLRVYVVVTSFNPLRAYVYREGLTRFASKPYSTQDKHMQDVYRHLTNYSINKSSPDFVENSFLEADNVGHKWSFSALNKHLKHVGVDTDLMWGRIMDLVAKTLLTVEPSISAKTVEFGLSPDNCFEVYGFDVLVDSLLKPWLLEVNLSPSMQADSPLDWQIKSALLADTFNIVGVSTTTASGQAHAGSSVHPPSPGVSHQWETGRAPMSLPQLGVRAGVESSQTILPEPSVDGTPRPGASVLHTLTDMQLQQIALGLAETGRCNNFVRLFPTPLSVQRYAPITEAQALRSPGQSISQVFAAVLLGLPVTPVDQISKPPRMIYQSRTPCSNILVSRRPRGRFRPRDRRQDEEKEDSSRSPISQAPSSCSTTRSPEFKTARKVLENQSPPSQPSYVFTSYQSRKDLENIEF